MKEFHAGDCATMFGAAMAHITAARLILTKKVSDSSAKTIVTRVLDPARIVARQSGLVESLGAIERLEDALKSNEYTHSEMHMGLSDLLELMQSEMGKILFLSVPALAREIFDKDKNFGEAVFDAFPSARMDIREAGNCLATDRYNGAVYHLCCAAEVGLRALARDRRVQLTNWNKNPLPLEFAQWGEIIKELRKKVDQIANWKAGKIRDAAHIFYNNALVEVQGFNDGWRRHVMHSRSKQYGETEAHALYVNVKRFLQILSQKIGEEKRTPIRWTKRQL